MKPKTILIVSVLLAACVAYVALREAFQPKPQDETSATLSKPLFEKSLADVTKLTIAPAGEPKMAFAKRDGQWHLIEPLRARASELRVNDVLRTVESLRFARTFKPGAGGEAGDDVTGLSKPAFVVTLADAGGKERTLHVGIAVPFTSPVQTYVRPAGDPNTYVAQTDFSHVLYSASTEYRDKTVLSVPAEQAARLAVVGESSFELQKIDHEWSLVKPVSARADEAKVSAMLGKLASVSAERFVDNPVNLAMYELEPGKERLVVRVWAQPSTPAGAPATASAPSSASAPAMREYALAIGRKNEDKVYAKLLDEPGVFQLDASLADAFQPKPADLRDRKILRFTPAEVSAVNIQIGPFAARIARIDSKDPWRMFQPVAGAASPAAVDKLLTALSGLQAADFPESQQPMAFYGLEAPKGKITLEIKGKAQILGLMLGSTSRTGEMTFVAPVASTLVAVVKSLDVQPLLAEPANYYDPQLLTLNKLNVRQIDLARKDGAFVVRREKGKWILGAPEKGDADVGSVENILGQLAALNATKVVSIGPAVPDKYAKAADPIVAKVALQAPTTASAPATRIAATGAATQATQASQPSLLLLPPAVLHVVKLNGNAYAWVDGQPNNPVGEFSAGLYDTLSAELRSRAVWAFGIEDVTGLKIVTPKETAELKKEQDKWALTSDPYVKIDAAKAASYLADLQNLRADRFLSTRGEDAGKYNFKDAALKVELSAAGKTLTLTIAGATGVWPVATTEAAAAPQARPAASSEVKGVFELPSATVDRLVKTWKDFQQSEAPPTPPPAPGQGGPGEPGMMPFPGE